MSVNSREKSCRRRDTEELSDSESERDNLINTKPSDYSQPRDYSPCRRWTFLAVLTFFSALGGFLFGYDTGVVSGAMLKIREDFTLSPLFQELIVSTTIAGAAIAALAAGPLSDLFGRKPVLLMAAFVFTVGAVVMSAAPTPLVLLVGRFIVGLGVGLAAMGVPMFIAESAPADIRGKLVVVNVSFITGGQFIATLIDGSFSGLPLNVGWRLVAHARTHTHTHTRTHTHTHTHTLNCCVLLSPPPLRLMLGFAAVPSIIMFLGLLFMPETPRWLVFHGKTAKAYKNLSYVSMKHVISSCASCHNNCVFFFFSVSSPSLMADEKAGGGRCRATRYHTGLPRTQGQEIR